MWNNILGHENQKQFLYKYINTTKRPHGLLFIGQKGLQKKELAINFAKSILCNNKTEADNCESCRLINTDTLISSHPDLMIVEQEIDEKTEKRKDISIEQIRELNKNLQNKPALSKYKICIINNADTMTIYAANSFLKLLEEPPPNTIIILTAESESKLLQTILSRVIKIKFYPVNKKIIQEKLINENFEPKKAEILAILSEGSLEKARELNQNKIFLLREKIITFIFSLPLKSPLGYLSRSKIMEYKKEEALLITDILNIIIRDLIFCKYKASELLYNIDHKEELSRMSLEWNLDTLEKTLKIVAEANTALEKNVNVKTVFETMILKINRIYNEDN